MATPRLIQRALELRDAAPLRERRPQHIFTKRLERPRAILTLVEKHAESDEIRYEARRQYVVALATAFEVYWREFFRFSLDRYRPTESQVAHLTKVSVTLADVGAILGRKLTFGELISCAYSFRGVEALNAGASAVLQLDAFASFREQDFKLDVIPTKKEKKRPPTSFVHSGTKVLDAGLPKIRKCFEVRNEVVHNIGTKYQLSRHDLFEIEAQINTFNIFFSLFLQGEFDARFGKNA